MLHASTYTVQHFDETHHIHIKYNTHKHKQKDGDDGSQTTRTAYHTKTGSHSTLIVAEALPGRHSAVM